MIDCCGANLRKVQLQAIHPLASELAGTMGVAIETIGYQKISRYFYQTGLS